MVWAAVVQTVQTADRSSYLYWTLLWSPAIFITISGSENGLTFLTTFDLKHQSSFRSSFRRTQSHANCSTGSRWIRRPKRSAGNCCSMAVMAGEVMGLFVCVWFGHKAFFFFLEWPSWDLLGAQATILLESLLSSRSETIPLSLEEDRSMPCWVPAAKGIAYPAPVISSPDAAQFQRTSLHFLFNHHQNLKGQTECF